MLLAFKWQRAQHLAIPTRLLCSHPTLVLLEALSSSVNFPAFIPCSEYSKLHSESALSITDCHRCRTTNIKVLLSASKDEPRPHLQESKSTKRIFPSMGPLEVPGKASSRESISTSQSKAHCQGKVKTAKASRLESIPWQIPKMLTEQSCAPSKRRKCQ